MSDYQNKIKNMFPGTYLIFMFTIQSIQKSNSESVSMHLPILCVNMAFKVKIQPFDTITFSKSVLLTTVKLIRLLTSFHVGRNSPVTEDDY